MANVYHVLTTKGRHPDSALYSCDIKSPGYYSSLYTLHCIYICYAHQIPTIYGVDINTCRARGMQRYSSQALELVSFPGPHVASNRDKIRARKAWVRGYVCFTLAQLCETLRDEATLELRLVTMYMGY